MLWVVDAAPSGRHEPREPGVPFGPQPSDCERASTQSPFNRHAPRIAPMMGLARELGAVCRLMLLLLGR